MTEVREKEEPIFVADDRSKVEKSKGLSVDEYCEFLPPSFVGRVKPKLLDLQNKLEEARTRSVPCFVLRLRIRGGCLNFADLSEAKPSGLRLLENGMRGRGSPEIDIDTIRQISCLPDEILSRRFRFTPGRRFLETDPAANNYTRGEEFAGRVKEVFLKGNGELWSLLDDEQIQEIVRQNPEAGKFILSMRQMLDQAKKGILKLWAGDCVVVQTDQE